MLRVFAGFSPWGIWWSQSLLKTHYYERFFEASFNIYVRAQIWGHFTNFHLKFYEKTTVPGAVLIFKKYCFEVA